MSYFVRKVGQRELLATYASKDESVGNSLAEYLNAQKSPVVSVTESNGEYLVVFFQEPKASDKK
jgi:hypothetical protein